MYFKEKRHCCGNEQYDDEMNVIVPIEEKCMFQCIKKADMELIKSIHDFIQIRAHLNQILIEYSKRNDTIQENFEVFI